MSDLPFHTWKLVPEDSYDFNTELTDDELYELDVIENLYRKIGDVIHENGMIWDFASGRQARLTIHEEHHEGTSNPRDGRSGSDALEAEPTVATA